MVGEWHGKDGTYYYGLDGKLDMVVYKDGTVKVSREFDGDPGLPIPNYIKENPMYRYYYQVGYSGDFGQRFQYYLQVLGSSYTNRYGVGFENLIPDRNAKVSGYQQGRYDYKNNYLPEF